MKSTIRRAFLLGTSLLTMAGSAFAGQSVDVQASQSLADLDSASQSLYNTAMIHVLVQDEFGPETGLGYNAGNGYNFITLPSGWSLKTIQVPAGGCALKPTQFYNSRDGRYMLRVLTASSTSTCKWKAGEYHVMLRYRDSSGFDRAGMGKFVIQ